jgi:hypothetical protein
VLFAALPAAAPPLDGRSRPVQDDLLDQLAGSWKLTGTAAGHPAHNDVIAGWVLEHQFLRICFGWRILMEHRDAAGQWKPFADEVLRPTAR